jgi:hypothetical protein
MSWSDAPQRGWEQLAPAGDRDWPVLAKRNAADNAHESATVGCAG